MTSGKERRRQRRHAERRMQEAWRALERGERALARKLAQRAVESGPMNPRLQRELGLVLWRLGELREAAEALRRAVRIAPTYREAFADLASLQAERGKFDSAARLQRRVVELDPDDFAAARLAARFEEQAGAPTPEPAPAAGNPDAAHEDPGPCPFASLDAEEIAERLETTGLADLGALLDDAGLAGLREFTEAPENVVHELVLDEAEPVVARVLSLPLPEPCETLRLAFAPFADRLLARWDAARTPCGECFGGPAIVAVPPGVAWTRHDPVARAAPALALAIGLQAGPAAVELLSEDVRFGRRRRSRVRALPVPAGGAAVVCVGARPARLAGALAWQPVRHGVRGGRVLLL